MRSKIKYIYFSILFFKKGNSYHIMNIFLRAKNKIFHLIFIKKITTNNYYQ